MVSEKVRKRPRLSSGDTLCFEIITPEIHNNLTGGVESKKVVCDALGLDMDYILGLGLTNVANQRVATDYESGNLTTKADQTDWNKCR